MESSIPEQPFVIKRMFTSVPSLSPPAPRFSGVQFNSLPADRHSLLYERLEQATGGQNRCLGLDGVKC